MTTPESALSIVAEQARDAGLWSPSATVRELQHELRRLHVAVEGRSHVECAVEALTGGSALDNWINIEASHAPTCAVHHPSGDLRYPLCVCGVNAAREKARAGALAALRRRAEDAEMIVRAQKGARGLRLSYWETIGKWSLSFGGRCLEVSDDGTGLPVLTDAVREALRKERDRGRPRPRRAGGDVRESEG